MCHTRIRTRVQLGLWLWCIILARQPHAASGCTTCAGALISRRWNPDSYQSPSDAVKTFPGKRRLPQRSRYSHLAFVSPQPLKYSDAVITRPIENLLFLFFSTSIKVQYWLHQLALELEERLTKDREAVRENILHGFYNCSYIHLPLFLLFILGANQVFPRQIFFSTSSVFFFFVWC